MLQNVNITKLDGQVGVALSAENVLAIIAPAKAGTVNQPTAIASRTAALAAFTEGVLVELAAYHLAAAKKHVVCVRCTAAPGTYGTIATANPGTSIPTASSTSFPTDDVDAVVRIVNPGTIGTAGITYQYSMDGGTNWSAILALGTALKFVLEKGVEINMAAGTVLATTVISLRGLAGVPTAQNISDALESLRTTSLFFDGVYVATPATALIVTQLDSWLQAQELVNRYLYGLVSFRRRTEAETFATYLAAFNTAFASTVTNRVSIGLDVMDLQSPVDERRYARPASAALGARVCSVDLSVDASAFALGVIPSATITDANNQPKYWDDYLQGGTGDDAKAVCARSWPGEAGVRFSNPRLFSAAGSDYVFLQHLRVINRACKVAYERLRARLSSDVLTDPATGFIQEVDALEIEREVQEALETELLKPRRCSAVAFTLSRTDNLLATFAMNGNVSVQFKGYPKTFNVLVGATNPAS
jgi:hypothetical protein